MQAAECASFDVLISEAPDRISRDMADLAGIHKALDFRGIRIECVNGGGMDIGGFRSLVEAVIVQPRKAGEEYEVRIQGRLAALMGVEMSAVQMVAGEGLEPSTD